jgi:hypothetical protein
MKRNIYGIYFVPVLYLLFLLVLSVSTTADELSGEFFPKDFPVLGGFYPNDFLLWSTLFFITIGLLLGIFLIKAVKGKILVFSVFLVLGTIVWFILGLYFQQKFIDEAGNDLLTELFRACTWAWIIGMFLAINIYQVEKNSSNLELHNS